MAKGMLITFEGIDGSGKSCHAHLLYEWLLAQGIDNVLLTREPGGSNLGDRIRALLLENTNDDIAEETEVLLFAADRAQHVADLIKPAVDSGQIVICDRYMDSFLAYQGGGRQMPLAVLQSLNKYAVQGYVPKLTFYMYVSLDEANSRRGQDHDRIEQEDRHFYARVKGVYDRLVTEEPHRFAVIDTAGTKEETFTQVQTVMKELLRQNGYGSKQ